MGKVGTGFSMSLDGFIVDEIGLELIPVLLGSGVRYFDNLGSKPIQLEQTQAIQGIGVTHLRYRVVK